MNVVILAGGQGTRLWPMSRQQRPKQFYDLLTEDTLLEDTYNRLRKRFEAEQMYVATLPEFRESINRLLPDIADDRIFLEPAKKDSGPAMAYACERLRQAGQGDEPVVFVPTDHYIADEERFLDALKAGEETIRETGKLLDIGVTPRFASTQLGYTHIGEKYTSKNGVDILAFKGHTEKPDEQTANAYLDANSYLWHANYYMWTPDRMLEAFSKHAPEITQKLEQIRDGGDVEQVYATMPEIPVDYALTEKIGPENVLIIRGDFGWSDIGTWNILYDRLRQAVEGEERNVTKGNHVGIDTSDSLVYGSSEKLIATIGVHDMIIVDTRDVLFVCPKQKAKDVKQLIKLLQERGFDRYL